MKSSPKIWLFQRSVSKILSNRQIFFQLFFYKKSLGWIKKSKSETKKSTFFKISVIFIYNFECEFHVVDNIFINFLKNKLKKIK